MTHTKTTLTESELKDYLREHMGDRSGFSPSCQSEIQAIQGGAKSTFEQPLFAPDAKIIIGVATETPIFLTRTESLAPKKRGRPKGSKNRPKEIK